MVMGKDSVNFMRFVFADLSDGHWHAEELLYYSVRQSIQSHHYHIC